MKRRFQTSLQKQSRRGFRGYPIATLAYYGPDDKRASKVAIGIIRAEGEEVFALERWYADAADVRSDPSINHAIVEFIRRHGVKSVVAAARIIGCPHEEGIDYPEGKACPQCPFWATRARWTGEPTH